MVILGTPTVENLIYQSDNKVYAILADEEDPQVFYFYYLFEIEENQGKSAKIKKEFMTENGLSITEKLPDAFLEEVLNNLPNE